MAVSWRPPLGILGRRSAVAQRLAFAELGGYLVGMSDWGCAAFGAKSMGGMAGHVGRKSVCMYEPADRICFWFFYTGPICKGYPRKSKPPKSRTPAMQPHDAT